MDLCDGVVFYFETAVIFCFVVFVVVVLVLASQGYIEIQYPRRERGNQLLRHQILERNNISNNRSSRKKGNSFYEQAGPLTLSCKDLIKEGQRPVTMIPALEV